MEPHQHRTAVDAPPDPSAITVVADELLLRLLLLGILLWPWHSSAPPPVEATWIANDVGMCVCVVVRVGEAVVAAAVAELIAADAVGAAAADVDEHIAAAAAVDKHIAAGTVAAASDHRHVTAAAHSTPETTDDAVGVHRAVAVC